MAIIATQAAIPALTAPFFLIPDLKPN